MAGAPADTANSAADGSLTGIANRFAQRVPPEVLVRRGACPFECCVYREWTARAELDVMRTERDTGAPLFTLPVGQAFRADSGNVHITGIALVAVADSVSDRPYWAFWPGDTLVVLEHIGEGHFNVWHEGEVKEVAGFWGAEQPRPVAERIGDYAGEWWVHITMADGRSGWIRADPPTRIGGADRCA